MHFNLAAVQPGLGAWTSARWPVILMLASLVYITAIAWITRVPDLATWFEADSLMRLVGVRAFLDGRGWYDLTETRLMPPDGVVMHWSRLVDLPMAGIIAGLEPFVGRATAEWLLVNIWPPLLWVPLAGGVAAIAARFGGLRAAEVAVIILSLTPYVVMYFLPGHLDHHNIQFVLVAWMLAALVRADRGSREGALAGLAAATSVAIGLETIVLIATAAAGLALAYVVAGERWRRGLIGFGLAFAAGVPLWLMATIDPALWLLPVCDAISPVYAVVALVGGLGAAAIATVPLNHGRPTPGDPLVRGGLFVGLGALLLAIVGMIAPECLAGPYGGIDERLGPIWLDNVAEASGFLELVRNAPDTAIAAYLTPLLTLALGLFVLSRTEGDNRAPLAMLIAVAAAGVASGMVQVRGMPPSLIVVAAIGGAVAGWLSTRFTGGGLKFLAARLIWVLMAPVVWTFLQVPFQDNRITEGRANVGTSLATCREEVREALVDRPVGLVLALSDIGTPILFATSHSVMNAPYHRNAAGILGAHAIFAAPPADAARLSGNVDYVAICLRNSEMRALKQLAPDGLAARLAVGDRPDWLQPLVVNEDTLVFERLADAVPADVTGSVAPPSLRPTLQP